LAMKFREFRVRRNPACPICGEAPTIKGLIDYEQFCGVRGEPAPAAAADITAEELKALLERGEDVVVLDVRNPPEWEICRLSGSTLIPLPELPARVGELDRGREMVVHCKSGMRSQKAIAFLRQQGFTRLRNLKGGILAWAERVDPSMARY